MIESNVTRMRIPRFVNRSRGRASCTWGLRVEIRDALTEVAAQTVGTEPDSQPTFKNKK